MFEYVTHYYNAEPFRSLSALSRNEALQVMKELCDDTPFFERFKEPQQYWDSRVEAETWLRDKFVDKGGTLKDRYPIYAVLGSSDWIENYSQSMGLEVNKLRIPLSILRESEVSFTFPDSMVSYWISRDKPEAYYQPGYHGQVFTLSEVRNLITTDIMDSIAAKHPEGTIPYVEAQIWNHAVVRSFYEQNQTK
ncbi:hypothetical protein [Cohnella sp. GCM10027633]|uniref:hypothetical protein n=1 Tax=unclassified Cohnella TaxID=2636738 RepID=UPI003630AD1D